jgi:hypothetical protein
LPGKVFTGVFILFIGPILRIRVPYKSVFAFSNNNTIFSGRRRVPGPGNFVQTFWADGDIAVDPIATNRALLYAKQQRRNNNKKQEQQKHSFHGLNQGFCFISTLTLLSIFAA